MNRFENLGVIKKDLIYNDKLLQMFTQSIQKMKQHKQWNKEEIVNLFFKMIPDFGHKETGKYLDSKM